MKTASAKNKGRILQQLVRDYLLKLFNLQENDVISTSMGASGVDIILSPEAKKSIPFAIECKNRAKVAVYEWYDQATSNASKNSEPLLIIKQNRRKPLVVVDMEYFFETVQERVRHKK